MTSAILGLSLILISLAVGMAGYHACESLTWLHAFANAAMILSGSEGLLAFLCPTFLLGSLLVMFLVMALIAIGILGV